MPFTKETAQIARKKSTLTPSTSLPNQEMYGIRALEMVHWRIQGLSVEQVAEKYNVSIDTVKRSVKYAVREGMVKKLENDVINKLGDLAVGVYKQKLEEGDVLVAKDTLDKIMKLGERFEQRETKVQEMSLDDYFKRKREDDTKTRPTRSVGVGRTRGDDDVVDAPRAIDAPQRRVEVLDGLPDAEDDE